MPRKKKIGPGASEWVEEQAREEIVDAEDQEMMEIAYEVTRLLYNEYDLEMQERLAKPAHNIQEASDEDEELVNQCIQIIQQEGRASTSLLQRRLRLGYTRAARIMDSLEERGIVGPSQGARDREILIRLDGAPPENS